MFYLSINPKLSNFSTLHNINLMDVIVLLNDNYNLDIWSCYNPPHSSIFLVLLSGIFSIVSNNSIFAATLMIIIGLGVLIELTKKAPLCSDFSKLQLCILTMAPQSTSIALPFLTQLWISLYLI